MPRNSRGRRDGHPLEYNGRYRYYCAIYIQLTITAICVAQHYIKMYKLDHHPLDTNVSGITIRSGRRKNKHLVRMLDMDCDVYRLVMLVRLTLCYNIHKKDKKNTCFPFRQDEKVPPSPPKKKITYQINDRKGYGWVALELDRDVPPSLAHLGCPAWDTPKIVCEV